MVPSDPAQLLAEAAGDFDGHEQRTDGAQVVADLSAGLTILRNSLYVRLHSEVEKVFGVDSMLMPISEMRTKDQTDLETEVYQVAECALAMRKGSYVSGGDEWFPGWLARLRLGPDRAEEQLPRVVQYMTQPTNERRLKFSDVLARVLPESRRAPLVLFRLFPMAVQLLVQVAFDDRAAAEQLRQRQRIYLPAIDDCQACRGQVLAADQQCAKCGNPLWNSSMLMATD